MRFFSWVVSGEEGKLFSFFKKNANINNGTFFPKIEKPRKTMQAVCFCLNLEKHLVLV